MNKPTENPTPRELYRDVCAAYSLAARLTTTRRRDPETYAEMSWFIWKVLYNCADYLCPDKEKEEGGRVCSPK